MGLLLGSSAISLSAGIQFVENATLDADHGQHDSLPNGFGDGEWTLQVYIEPYQVDTIGTTTGSPGNRENWASENDAVGSSSTWWFQQNFLLDGINNNGSGPGSFSLGVRGCQTSPSRGYICALINDDDAGVPTGGLWGLQDFTGTNILDGSGHWVAFVAANSGASDREYRLYVDSTLQDSVTSGTRRDFYTNDWTGDNWSAYPSDETGFDWGSEKQAANGDFDYPDYKGTIRAIVFSDGALSTDDMQAGTGSINTGQADYMDHFAFTEGSGTTTTSENGVVMSLNNEQSGGFWP